MNLQTIWQATTDGSYASFYVVEPSTKRTSSNYFDFRVVVANNTSTEQWGCKPGKFVSNLFDSDLHLPHYNDAFQTKEQTEYVFGDNNEWRKSIIPVNSFLVIRIRYISSAVDNLTDSSLHLRIARDKADYLVQLIRDAGHDLRTPLAVMRLSIHLANKMLEKEDYSAVKGYLLQAEEQVGKLQNILLDLVESTKQNEVTFSVINVADLVYSTFEEFSALEAIVGRTIIYIPPVRCDSCQSLVSEVKLRRAVVNLLKNAFTYTDDGAVVSLTCYSDERDVFLSVADTGIGIPKNKLDDIFRRNYRLDEKRGTGHNKGSGLAIVKEVVEMHGGDISVCSELGVGSIFTISLPQITNENL